MSRRTIHCPKCGNASTTGTIYLILPILEAAPVLGIAGSVVQVEGPMTRRPISERARLECGHLSDDGTFCGHRFVPQTGLDALVWSPHRE